MDVEIRPEPEPEELEALLTVVRDRLRAGADRALPPQYRSEWRRAGLLDATDALGAYAAGPAPRPQPRAAVVENTG